MSKLTTERFSDDFEYFLGIMKNSIFHKFIAENRLKGYFTAGLKIILLEKISELKAMRESKDKLVEQLAQADDALGKVLQKTAELDDVERFMNQNKSIDKSVDVPKPRATVPTPQVSCKIT